MSLLFALIAETALVQPSQLYMIARAVEKGAKDCAEAWGKEPPAVDVFEARRGLPDGCCPIVFIDDQTELQVLADHYWDPLRLLPAGRVWANRATDLFLGGEALSVLTSHEVDEALVDGPCDGWDPCPGRPGVKIAREVCDPVQTEYVITTPNGAIAVANFVTPSYLDTSLADFGEAQSFRSAGGRFDFKGELGYAGQIGINGYAILLDETHVWDEGPTGAFSAAKAYPGKMHPWSRTERRHLTELMRRTS